MKLNAAAGRPWVRDLTRRGVINDGDDVTVVVLPKGRSVGAFRQSVRLLGWVGLCAGVLSGVAGVQWMTLLLLVMVPVVVVLFCYALVKDGLLASLGVVLVSPAAVVLAFLVASGIMLMR